MNNENYLLEMLDILKEDLTEEQLQKLGQAGAKLAGKNVRPEHLVKILNETGLDLDMLQTKAKKVRAKMNAQKPKKVKVGRNEQCPCKSGKKYKKCCDGKIDINETQ